MNKGLEVCRPRGLENLTFAVFLSRRFLRRDYAEIGILGLTPKLVAAFLSLFAKILEERGSK